MSHVIFGMLVMTGRVTVLGLSRWTQKGGSYRSIQRLYQSALPWKAIQWVFFRKHFLKPEDEYILAGDEVVVGKAGKKTHGLGRFFSGVQALTRLWQCEADARRHARSIVEQQRLNQVWGACLDNACATLGDQLWSAWNEVAALLGNVWRGSSLAECINSKLRPVLDRRDQTDQGYLELFQFLHNTRVFACGKRAGHSPAQLVNLDVPNDPLTLLGLAPKCQSNFPAF